MTLSPLHTRLREAYAGRRVLVTGAAGFIGSHVTEALLDAGVSVRGLVKYTSLGGLGWLEESLRQRPGRAERLEPVHGDIADTGLVASAVEGCDAVLHLAALIGIPYSYAAPASYASTNIQGTINVLEASRHFGVKRVLVTSTSEVYGTARYVPIDEEHPLQAQSPYAASKIAGDQMALSYARSFGLHVTVVRPFNTYGPRQSRRAVIPALLTQAIAAESETNDNEPLRIRLGSLDPVRDLTYVSDTARGFLSILAADGLPSAQTINLGTGSGVSVAEMVQLASKILGRKIEVLLDSERVRPQASEVWQLVASAERARQLVGWQASTRLEDGITQTLSWLRSQPKPFGSPARYVT